jgi:two-component system sensor histidine kinase EvgS
VLLVDDDPVNRSLLSQLVESLGHHVVVAESGEQVLARFREGTFHVAILDWQLPDMNGGQLAAALRALDRELNRQPMTLVSLSAAIEREPINNEDRECLDRWLTKPVSQADLAIVLGSTGTTPNRCENRASRWSQPLARLGGSSGLLAQLAQSYSAGLPELLERLQAAATEGRSKDVARLAHLISGQASIFDAYELIAIAKSVEELACAHSFDLAHIAALEARCSALGAELDRWLTHDNTVAP